MGPFTHQHCSLAGMAALESKPHQTVDKLYPRAGKLPNQKDNLALLTKKSLRVPCRDMVCRAG